MSRVRALDALDIDLSIAHSIKSIRQIHVTNIENCRCNYNSTFQRQYRYDFEKINSMDSGQNRLYTTFPNIFSLISADPADLSKNYFSKKNTIFG